jgi:hypothetical protein
VLENISHSVVAVLTVNGVYSTIFSKKDIKKEKKRNHRGIHSEW